MRVLAILPVLIMHFGTAMLKESKHFNFTEVYTNSVVWKIQFLSIGVPIFFGISGFILSLPFFKNKAGKLSDYYLKRLIRIEPPYLIALSLFFIVHLLLQQKEISFLIERFLYSFFYIHNFKFPEAFPYILPVAWSLEIEIQFYIFLPILMAILAFHKSVLWRFAIYATLIYISLEVELFKGHDLNDYLFYFIAGIFVADVFSMQWVKRTLVWDIVFLAIIISYSTTIGFFHYAIVRCICIALLILSALHLSYLRQAFTSKYLTVIGGMCYTLYLLHYPLFILIMRIFADQIICSDSWEVNFVINAIIFLPISIALMAIYFISIEKPFMQLSKQVIAKRKARRAAKNYAE